MILLSFLLLALLAGLPVLLCLWQGRRYMRLTQQDLKPGLGPAAPRHAESGFEDDTTVAAFHRDRRARIENDPACGTLAPQETPSRRWAWIIGVYSLLLIPCLGFFLYALNGRPLYGPQPAQPALASLPQARFEALQRELDALAPQDPARARVLVRLGLLEQQSGLDRQTIHDWQQALELHFTPELALQIAELLTRDAGTVTPEALALYHRALDAAPADAPWRLAVEARIATGEHALDEAGGAAPNPPAPEPPVTKSPR
ncbi:hypothetical protein E3E11_06070 [Oecophyllibacter saccharovorans]|uniref:hypothetical protein n=1 Tax=Oecophyllibacter saccharovorans TaxID=2558360 RepID=UPI0011421293|nr:hypothetical protein [Oecophyllibacter saccharovorans]QDH15482.1 hypothetical protein E3E11_06070 [Oecophyllibacter saccharovorans]